MGVPTANMGPPFDTHVDKLGRIIQKPPSAWYPNVAYTKFDGIGALTVYRQILQKEVPKERKMNGYQLRSAIKEPSSPNRPHRTDPARERGPPPVDGGVDVSQWGFDPASDEGKFLRKCVDVKRGRLGPQDRLPFTELSQQEVGWTQAKPLNAYRSRSVPVIEKAVFNSEYEWLQGRLHENAERNHCKRVAKVTAAEANVDSAMKKCLSYTYHGSTAQKYSRPVGETDATSFQKKFIEIMRVPIHKNDPKPGQPVVVMKPGTRVLADQWKP